MPNLEVVVRRCWLFNGCDSHCVIDCVWYEDIVFRNRYRVSVPVLEVLFLIFLSLKSQCALQTFLRCALMGNSVW